LITSVLIISACQPPPADPMKVETLDLDTEQQKQSYAMGANIGHIVENKIAHQTKVGVEYDQNLLVKAFIAALQGQSQLDKLEIQSINRRVETHVREKMSN
jgi:FKBP-type peptidyl-prolyl cis-trans isomerase FkpA